MALHLQLFLVMLLWLAAFCAWPAMTVVGPQPEVKPSDTDALTIFRYGADAHGILASNWSTPDACAGHWVGVGCSPDGRRVTSLSLPSLDLRGRLDPLAHLGELRVLDLHGNRLNGTLVPLLLGVPTLKLLYLSHNDISGPLPDTIGLLPRLLRIDVSDNSLRGPIPAAALGNLTRLLTLRLQDNLLSGLLPDISTLLPRLADFNASNNQLAGRLSDGMRAKFGLASFAGNIGLCGPTPPLPPCSFLPHEPAPSSVPSSSSSPQAVVPSNPASSSSPVASSSSGSSAPASGNSAGKGGLSTGAIVGIAVGNALFLLVLLSLLVAYCCCSGASDNEQALGAKGAKKKRRGGRIGLEEGDQGLYGSGKEVQPAGLGSVGRCSDGGESDGAQSRLVFFGMDGEGGEEDDDGGSDSSGGRRARGGWMSTTSHQQGRRRSRFELEALLRASAEMVGKGSLGTVYRAVLEDGRMVAVKRLRDTNPCARKEFHRYMDLMGRLRHPNLVPLRAFYYAKQEKLLIYDYLPNGTLHARLHGNRSSGQTPLDWTTRVALVLGAARGLACIHEEYSMSGIPHGNVKSSNVLLDKNGIACVADFGLALLLSPAHAIARLGGYMAPEQADSKRHSQEADVYSFGVLILEVLTGRAPAQYLPPLPDANQQKKDNKAGGVSSSSSKTGITLPEWVRSVVREEWTAEVFDVELLRYKNIEEEMVAMLHVGLACVAQQPEQRPSMSDVVKMIENIPVDQSPLPEEDRDLSISPSAGITTDDGRVSY